MFSRLRDQIGTAGLIVAIVALVAALGGGAYAASSGGGKHYKKTAQGPRGPQGKQGKQGKQGPAGPAGPVGPAGPAGSAGAAGSQGNPGATGATGSQGATGAAGVGTTGPTGNKGPTGPTGVAGATGATGNVGSTLTTGQGLKGVWALSANSTKGGEEAAFGGEVYTTAVSYGIPLQNSPTMHFIHVGETPPTGCSGTAAAPVAASDNLCVFAKVEENVLEEFEGFVFYPTLCDIALQECNFGSPTGEGPGGVLGFGIQGAASAPGRINASGTWAVTVG